MNQTMASEHVLTQLAALTARLDAQGAEIVAVRAENERLRVSGGTSPSRSPGGDSTEPTVGRRRLLTKVLGATAVAALLTAAKDARIAHAESRTTVLAGSASTANFGIASTYFGNGGGDPATLIANVTSAGTGHGVIGTTSSPGFAPPSGGSGVLGQGNSFHGVVGLSNTAVGTFGQSTNNVGVRGESTNSFGMLGSSPSSYGVYGVSTSGAGVFGSSTTGFGVYGYSSGSGGSSVGLYGVANTGEGLVGLTHTGIGVHGNAIQPSGLAGRFDGKVLVNGTLTVTGGLTTSAIASADGDYRRMYSQESPEPWVEDFGTATLKGGGAEVALDAELDAVVESTEYLVFLTPVGGECGALYISRKGEHGFEVRSYAGPIASGSFDYRVVARRRDVAGKRLERVPAANVNQGKDSPPPPAPRSVPDARLVPSGPTLRPDGTERPRP